MKICYLADALSVHIQQWVEYFVDKGYEIDVISFRQANISGANVHFINVGNVSYKGGIRNWQYLIRINRIKELIHKIKPNILHAHYITSYGFIGALVNFHPYVISALGSDILIAPRESLFLRLCIKKAINRADLIISHAFHLFQALISMGANKEKSILFGWGVDLKRISKEVEPQREENTVISARQFEPIYNLELLIRAIPYVIKFIPDANFILIGDGTQKEQLENLAHKLKIDEHVKFLGKISHSNVLKHLGSSQIYTSTSLSDGTSATLLEAMALGAFPVVTDIPANREWIQDGINGFLVPTSDPKRLAERIVDAIRCPQLREDAKIKNAIIISEKANFKKNMQIIENEYRKLLKQVQ
ncbi:MAG: glycosyltransferase [bacterium]|nr:glycosyltransferase [bacterium]